MSRSTESNLSDNQRTPAHSPQEQTHPNPAPRSTESDGRTPSAHQPTFRGNGLTPTPVSRSTESNLPDNQRSPTHFPQEGRRGTAWHHGHDVTGVRRPDRAARPGADRGQHLPGRPARRGPPTGLRRTGRRPGARRRGAHGRRAGRHVHSLHAYFLRPGDPTFPILYEVDRLRDGRSFTTRRVVAIQHGRPIFNLQASFHDPEPGLDYHVAGPGRRAPPRVAADVTRAAGAPSRPGRRLVRPAPPDRHPLRPARPGVRARASSPTGNSCGCGPTATLPDDPVLHACIVTYASDMTLLDTALRPSGISLDDGRPHDGEPRPRNVVPPTVPRRRVAAVPADGTRRARRHVVWPAGRSSRPTASSSSTSCKKASSGSSVTLRR